MTEMARCCVVQDLNKIPALTSPRLLARVGALSSPLLLLLISEAPHVSSTKDGPSVIGPAEPHSAFLGWTFVSKPRYLNGNVRHAGQQVPQHWPMIQGSARTGRA